MSLFEECVNRAWRQKEDLSLVSKPVFEARMADAQNLLEGFAGFSIELADPNPDIGEWEYRVPLSGDELLDQLDRLREPPDIVLNDVTMGNRGLPVVYFVVSGSSEQDARHKLEKYLVKALGSQKSLF